MKLPVEFENYLMKMGSMSTNVLAKLGVNIVIKSAQVKGAQKSMVTAASTGQTCKTSRGRALTVKLKPIR